MSIARRLFFVQQQTPVPSSFSTSKFRSHKYSPVKTLLGQIIVVTATHSETINQLPPTNILRRDDTSRLVVCSVPARTFSSCIQPAITEHYKIELPLLDIHQLLVFLPAPGCRSWYCSFIASVVPCNTECSLFWSDCIQRSFDKCY